MKKNSTSVVALVGVYVFDGVACVRALFLPAPLSSGAVLSDLAGASVADVSSS